MKLLAVILVGLIGLLGIQAQDYFSRSSVREMRQSRDNDLEFEFEVDDEDEESFDEDQDQDQEFDNDSQDFSEDEDHELRKRFLHKKRQATQDFRDLALKMHNEYRARHGSPPLVMDDKLNQEAQAYADKEARENVQKHSCGPCDKYGENLAYKASTGKVPTGLEAAKWAVNSWYDEVSLYNFKNPGGGDMHKWGHFTALVWKASTKMGIGVTYGTKVSQKGNKMNTVYVVARYLPPGNMLTPEAMRENVLPPS